jgi:hypothetical protein
MPPREQKGFLRGVVGVFGILKYGSREASRRGCVPIHQLSISVTVTPGSSLGEFGVAHVGITRVPTESLDPDAAIRDIRIAGGGAGVVMRGN